MDIFPITALPTEIRGMIFNRLPQDLVEKIRVVCKQWKNEIETNFDFYIELNEKNPHLGNLLERRVYSCYVWKFLKTPSTRTRIFKYPNVVKILNFGDSDDISGVNLNQLLLECGNHLRKIRLMLTASLLDYTYEFNPTLNFNNLVDLGLYLTDSVEDISKMSEMVKNLFLPNLKLFRLSTCNKTGKELSVLVLIFVCRHLESLRQLNLSFSGADWLITETDIKEHADLSLIVKKCRMVNSLNSVSFHFSNITIVGLWRKLINSFKDIEYFYVNNLTWDSIILLVLNNYESLTYVRIHNYLSQFDHAFDMSIFKNCSNLNDLSIRLSSPPANAVLINLVELPTKLRQFETREHIYTEDVYKYFSSPRQITDFSLYNCGTSNSFGVNGSVLEQILNKFGCVRLFIKGFNLTDLEEKNKFESVLKTYNIPLSSPFDSNTMLERNPIKTFL